MQPAPGENTEGPHATLLLDCIKEFAAPPEEVEMLAWMSWTIQEDEPCGLEVPERNGGFRREKHQTTMGCKNHVEYPGGKDH